MNIPWVLPVLAWVLIAMALIVCGFLVLLFEMRGRPLSTELTDWALITVGELIVIASFCLDCRNILAGGFPHPFNWRLFFAGLSIAVITFAFVVLRRLKSRPPPSYND